MVIGGIAGGIAWFNSPAGLTEGTLFDLYTGGGIVELFKTNGFSGVFTVLPNLQYAFLSFIGVGLTSLVTIRMLGDVLIDIYKIPELRNRICWTLGLLAVFRFGFFVYLPGIDIGAYEKQLESDTDNPLDWLMYTSRLTGGSFTPVLFSLGIMPYISASIIFSLLVKVFPYLEALSKEGEAGRRQISKYTRYATVVLCIVQSMFLIWSWKSPIPGDPDASTITLNPGFWICTLQLLCLTAGSMFVMWLGEKITEYGIGNGTSLLIMAGIISDVPRAIAFLLGKVIAASGDDRPYEVTTCLLVFGLFVAIVAAVVFITKGQRRIPIQQQRAVKGRRVYGGQRQYMPVKVNAAGVLPVIFASSLLMIPTLFLSSVAFSGSGWFFGFLQILNNAFAQNGFLYVFCFVGMIIFFTYFWTSLYYNPVEIAGNMKEYGSFIPGIRPGRRTAEYLEKIFKRITLAGAVFLCVIALVPTVLAANIEGMNFIVTQFLGGTGILIVVGVSLDFVEKIEAQLLVRQYEGFMRGGDTPRGGSSGGSDKKPVATQ
ncbi:MAG: preprotein translocase subunit SecY [Planctomycetota bacterium]|nr:preprotein translocase subunit SecY [Planctomycetota bacterium]